MTTITRAALYAQVWAQPMTALAPTHDLSAAALKTLCDRYDVPTPRGGYWQKKSAGRAGAPRALPIESWPADQVIDLAAPPPKSPRPIAKAVRPRPSAVEALTAPRPKPAAQPSWAPSTNEPAAVRALRKALERAKPTPIAALPPGARLSREWKGVRHDVIVEGDGRLRWEGGLYNSLSEIARAITGTRWNGPRFFGMREEGAP